MYESRMISQCRYVELPHFPITIAWFSQSVPCIYYLIEFLKCTQVKQTSLFSKQMSKNLYLMINFQKNFPDATSRLNGYMNIILDSGKNATSDKWHSEEVYAKFLWKCFSLYPWWNNNCNKLIQIKKKYLEILVLSLS